MITYLLKSQKPFNYLTIGLVLEFLFLFSASSEAQYVNYAEEPITIEYDVDMNWPQRPDSISRRGYVSGLAIDDKDQVWLFKKGRDPIQVYTTEGEFVRSWGRDLFDSPHFLKIDHEGHIWIADFGLHVVEKYTQDGELLLTLGVKGEAGSDEKHFNMPTDMAISPSGDVFITDGYGNRRIVHYDKNGNYVKSWGQYGSSPGSFILPHAIVIDSKGRLYVADRNSGRIQVFNQRGKLLDQWSNLIMPWGMSINENDEIWICGSSPHWWLRDGKYPEYKDQVFMRFSTDGKVQQIWHIPLGNIGEDKNDPDFSNLLAGEAVGVHSIAQDSKGNLFVGEIYSERAEKFNVVSQRAISDTARPVSDSK